MSLRDTWTRRNRAMFRDSRTAFLSAVEAVVLEQLWAIACDEGEADGDDVLAPAATLDPCEIMLELPRSPDFTIEAVTAAALRLRELGFVTLETQETARVGNVARYNSRRFLERERKRSVRTTKGTSQRCPPDKAPLDPPCRRGAVQDSNSTEQHYNNTPRQAGEAVREKPKRKAKKRKPDPRAVALADAHLAAARRWKPDVADNFHTAASLEAYRLLLSGGSSHPPRDFDEAVALVQWLQGGLYAPVSDFDWRPNVLSGSALRKHWDRLTALRANGRSGGQSQTADAFAQIEREIRNGR